MQRATLNELKTAWVQAKQREQEAQTERRAIEDAMLALMDHKDEGTVTDKDTGISATFKLTRTVDTPALQAAWVHLPEHAQQAFKWKADIDTKAYRGLSDFDQDSFKAISKFITTKPAKPTITVKEN